MSKSNKPISGEARKKLTRLSKELKLLMSLIAQEEAKKIKKEIDRMERANGKDSRR
jgi:hypothetical protein